MKGLLDFGLVGALGVIATLIALIIGWVLNIIAVFGCDFDPVGKEEIIRIIGIFVLFIGGVTGWISF